MGFGETCLQAQKIMTKATFYSLVEAKETKEMTAAPAPTSKTPQRKEFVVDSGASMHMLSKRDLGSDEMDTLRRSTIPTTVVEANGEVQTNEEERKRVG